MAEALGTASSVLTLVDWGLKLHSGISQYLDAFESRNNDLRRAKDFTSSLQTSLSSISDVASRNAVESSEGSVARRAVIECLTSCRAEMQALDRLVQTLQFSMAVPDSRAAKARVMYKKLQYPFEKPKVEKLVKRLKSVNHALQIALNSLIL